jgi:hypothetical protein
MRSTKFTFRAVDRKASVVRRPKATATVIRHAVHVGRVGALAVALGVGAAATGMVSSAWADDSAGGTTSTQSSGSAGSNSAGATSSTAATSTQTDTTATDDNPASPKLNLTQTQPLKVVVRASGGSPASSQQPGALPPAPQLYSTPSTPFRRKPLGDPSDDASSASALQHHSLSERSPRVSPALQPSSASSSATSSLRLSEQVPKTDGGFSTGMPDAAALPTAKTLAAAAETSTTLPAAPGQKATSTPSEKPKSSPAAANTVVRVMSGLLDSFGFNPDAGNSPERGVPTQTLVGALQLLRRNLEDIAPTSSPAASTTITSALSPTTASWLPATPIQPGSSVQLAVQQLSAAQALLTQATWGSGDVLAGFAAITPLVLLSQAQSSLTQWQTADPAAQAWVASSVGNPFVHGLAVFQLSAIQQLPSWAQFLMVVAQSATPAVGTFGAPTAASQVLTLVGQAQQNGMVYAFIPLQMKYTTEPIINISINGGPRVPVVVDTGSAGLVITAPNVGGNLGVPTGSGTSGYSGGLTYNYDTYTATVDFGNGIVTAPTSVNIVSPGSQQAFADYIARDGAVGVLGIGPNALGPGPSIVTTALPGELKDGVLINEAAGVLVLGPNTLPVRTSLAGAPYSSAFVRLGNGSLVPVWLIIDSGGVYGTIPAGPFGFGQVSGNLPAGTPIVAYAPDGQTVLYSYTTTVFNTPFVTPLDDAMNTGYTPFAQGPVYIGFTGSGGTTNFDYA